MSADYDTKEIERRHPFYFIFGEWPDGRVDVNDGSRDIVTKVTRAEAGLLITQRNELIDYAAQLRDALVEVKEADIRSPTVEAALER